MRYSNNAISDALSVINSRRRNAESKAEERAINFKTEHPELAEIEREMADTTLGLFKAINNCPDPKKVVNDLKEKNLGFQKARKALFEACGVDENYLKPDYTCKKCNDTGYHDGKMCECLEELLKKSAFDELAKASPLKISKFEDFDPSIQSKPTAKKKATEILKFCEEYANDFGTDSQSLFFYGETGLGKTHISLAIAGKVIEKGYGVVYGSAQNLFSMLERERFGRSENPDGTTEEKLLCCDLLILDDLGAEFTTQFTIAELYNIINTRMAKELPTIINSNAPIEELEKQYSPRATSRIIGTYKLIQFIGNDVRQLKNNE